MRLRNLALGIADQSFRSFFVTRDGWGIFSRRSHVRHDGKEKVAHQTKRKAEVVAHAMSSKSNSALEAYKCIYCDGYHIGRNR